MKSVLLIAHDFPPARTSGVYRPVKFSRYLPEFGWRPVILTVRETQGGSRDAGLLAELPPGTPIYRTTELSLRRAEDWFYDLFFTRATENPVTGSGGDGQPATASSWHGAGDWLKRRLLSPAARRVRDRIWIPDEYIGWYPFALWKGIDIVRREGIDAILSTSSPATSQLIGRRLARWTGVPFIADFRDPWTDNAFRDSASPARYRRERALEAGVLRDAAKVLHLTERQRALSERSFPDEASGKHCVIGNGFDERDFTSVVRLPRLGSEPIRFTNVGTIYETSGYQTMLAGFERVFQDPALRDRVQLEFVGPMGSEVRTMLARPAFQGRTIIHGVLPHAQAIDRMMQTDVHLLTIPRVGRHGFSNVPGKLYELLRAGGPVLLVGWPSESWDLLTEAGVGTLVDADGDPGAVAEAVRGFVLRSRSGELRLEPRTEAIRRHDRRALTGTLARELDAVVAQGHPAATRP